MQNEKTISIIIPALNESRGIENTIRAIPREELERIGYRIQILVVDNGSDDSTYDIARKAGAEVIFEPRRGYGYAYKSGFANASGEIIVTSDADETYPIKDVAKLVQMLEKDSLDFITTDRLTYMKKGVMSKVHTLGNKILNYATRLLYRINLKDSQSGMWIFRRNLLDRMVLKANTMALSEEIKIEACYFNQFRWKEVPIQYQARIGRVKLRTLRDGFGNLLYLLKKRVIR